MLRTNLDAWRATLFVSLGLAATACGGRALREDAAEFGDPMDVGTGVDDTDGELEPAGPQALLPLALRCEDDKPSAAEPALRQCANGIVHRPALDAAVDCPGCPPKIDSFVAPPDRCGRDDDCQDGALCIATVEVVVQSFCQATRSQRYFACQSPSDACGADSQCGAGKVCALTAASVRSCIFEGASCSEGRPFLVEGEARVAPLLPSSAWCGSALAPPAELDSAALRAAAHHWQSAALMEHASIAAFGRFTLQLLQLGAPPELCLASQQAMQDETEHARRCFALAARYAGVTLGPGPLPMAGALAEESLASIARLTFREGCIGETVAALQAAEALAVAADADVRQALELIARDERRHAELAWRFVGWALEQDATGEVRAALRGELRRARERALEPAAAPEGPRTIESEAALARHGVLSAEHCAELRRRAIFDVVLPCGEGLLAAGLRAA